MIALSYMTNIAKHISQRFDSYSASERALYASDNEYQNLRVYIA